MLERATKASPAQKLKIENRQNLELIEDYAHGQDGSRFSPPARICEGWVFKQIFGGLAPLTPVGVALIFFLLDADGRQGSGFMAG